MEITELLTLCCSGNWWVSGVREVREWGGGSTLPFPTTRTVLGVQSPNSISFTFPLLILMLKEIGCSWPCRMLLQPPFLPWSYAIFLWLYKKCCTQVGDKLMISLWLLRSLRLEMECLQSASSSSWKSFSWYLVPCLQSMTNKSLPSWSRN